jgi:hypothetical protein
MLEAIIRKTRNLPAEKLSEHVFSTYASVRYGMAVIAALFPLILVVGGWRNGVPLQDSMSAYYWALGPGVEYPPMRIWFVGILFIVGAFLYLYKGFTPLENYALNGAGVCALGVALFPMFWGPRPSSSFSLHGTFAVVLFLCIAYVSLIRAKDTLVLIADETLKARYRRWYWILGISMVASPLTAFVANTVVIGSTDQYVFFIETAGIYAFAAYWYLKSRELARTNAELHAVHGDLSATPQGVVPDNTPRVA